jgi:hypothetical protein
MIRTVQLFLLLLLIGVSVLQNLWLIALGLSLFVSYSFGAVGLVMLAIAIDAYFGAFSSMPYFSFVTLLWYIISELLRLRLRIME